MALGFDEREYIRVKIKYVQIDGSQSYCQFSIDPKITTYNNLLQLVQRRFEITSDFSINYLVLDKYGEQTLLPLQSDMDLDAALMTASEMTLRIFVEAKPKQEGEWDIVGNGEAVLSRLAEPGRGRPSTAGTYPGRQVSSLGASKTATTTSSSSALSSPAHIASTLRSAIAGGNFLQNFSQHIEKTVSTIEKAIGGLRSQSVPPRPPICDAEFRRYMDNLGRIIQPAEFFRNVYLGGIEPSLRKVAWRILLNIYPAEVTGRERIAFLSSKCAKYETMKDTWRTAYREGRLSKAQIEAVALASVDVVRTDRSHPFYVNDGKNQRISQLFNILATFAIYHPGVGYHQGMSNLASPLLYVEDSEAAAYVCFCALMHRLRPKFCPLTDQLAMIVQMQHLHDLLVYTDYELAQFLRLNGLGNMFFTERWLLLELVREFSFADALHVSEVQWAALAAIASSWPPRYLSDEEKGKQLSEEPSAIVFETADTHYTRCETKLINALVGEEFIYNSQPDKQQSSPLNQPVYREARRPERNSTGHGEGEPVHMKDWVVELPPPDELGGGTNPFLLFVCVSMLLEYRVEILNEVREASDLFHLFQSKNKQHNPISILNRARSLFDEYLRDQEIKRRGLTEYPVVR